MSKKIFSVSKLLLFILVFGLIGGGFTWRSFAAATTVAVVEAENMQIPSTASVINDETASNGKSVQMNVGSSLTGQVSLPSNATSVNLTVKGEKCRGRYPEVTLEIDNNIIFSKVPVTFTAWHTYSANVSLTAASHNLTITDSGKCSNLYIDVTAFIDNVAQPPPPPGVIATIPSNIADDCSTDVTSAILSWIASVPDNSTLQFGTSKCYRIESVLQLQNRVDLVFDGNGSTFKSLNAPADQRPFWRVYGSTGIKFHDLLISGSYANPGTFTSSLQHAHGFDLRGTTAEIYNVTINNVAGDCVYFGLGSDGTTHSSGSFHNSDCNGTGRNGVSTVAADNILVQYVSTNTIGYETFDVEPNVGPNNGDCNGTFDSNTIGTYYLYAWSVVESGSICNQTFSNNHVIGPKGLKIFIGDPLKAGFRAKNITITGNWADHPATPTPIDVDHVDYLTITGNTVPMIAAGYMAVVDGGCQVNVSGNSYAGGSAELYSINPVTSC